MLVFPAETSGVGSVVEHADAFPVDPEVIRGQRKAFAGSPGEADLQLLWRVDGVRCEVVVFIQRSASIDGWCRLRRLKSLPSL